MRYLRNRKDGFIYEYNEQLAQHPLCEEVSEQVAFPERFLDGVNATPAVAVGLAEARKRGKKVAENLATADIPTPPQGNPDINNDASRRLPPIAGAAAPAPAAAPITNLDLDGIMKM